MSITRNGKLVLVAVILSLIGGCQYVGPIAIDQGRNRYNSIIQSTTKQQTFVNIIGVHNHESTSFMDVTEVDATTTFSSTINGGISGIGAKATKSTTAGTLAGQVGALTGGVTYTEQPLIRYAPLLGAALVAQLVTPVSVDALEDLFNSSWNTSPLLDLATSHLTLDRTAVYPVLNILGELDSHNALAFVATKSDLAASPAALARSQGAGKGGQGSGNGGNNNRPPPNDALTIYLNPFHVPGAVNDPYLAINRRELQLWIGLLRFYQGTQERFMPQNPALCAHIGLSASSANELSHWDWNLQSKHSGIDPSAAMKCLPNSIELRTMPVIPAKLRTEGLISGAPLLKTFSAVGILKNATETPNPKIEFVSPERYHEITGYEWNEGLDHLFFYVLLPRSEDPADNPAVPGINDAAAYRNSAWLLKRQAISVLPSVASLRALRVFAHKDQGTKPMIGFGDPVFNPDEEAAAVGQRSASARTASKTRTFTDFWQGAGVDRAMLNQALPRLEDTADELKAVAKKLGAPATDIHLRADASETTVKRAPLADYRVVYFATHGLVAGDIKGLGEPSLALSIPPQPSDFDDGLLTASEVAQLKLNADWVVLSACNTIAGDKPGAEALSGLARAFFYAGARALLVTHWPVASDAATRLTISTFGAIKSDASIGRAEALRRAMLAYLNDASDPLNAYPAFWGPFELVGDGSGR